ncbi:protein YIPF3-like [Cephus cinctus]|uniref:Protein YIPF3-like n=1 Tax=Cephus cinctus TaxID=211228 RepID=A0AAJ7CDE6_CEPCN|nr:protein YIPF3-like [Cephus cinctus]
MSYKASGTISLDIHRNEYNRFGGPVTFTNRYLKVKPREIVLRAAASLAPPCTKFFKRTELDLIGPLIALVILIMIIHYGYIFKDPTATDSFIAPISTVFSYAVFVPIVGFIICKFARAAVTFWDIATLLGYGLYSHIIILCMNLVIYQEESNTFFFICLFIFGGSSALRMSIILLSTIPKPAARLLVCSTLFIIHLLYAIFLYFTYMHPTFVYGIGNSKKVSNVIHNNL